MRQTTRTALPRAGAALALLAIVGCGAQPPPEPELTLAERTLAATEEVVRCLTDRGWTATVAGPGEFTMEHHSSQNDAADEARRECLDLHMRGLNWPDITADHANAYFDALEESAACLTALGFTVSDPPSRAALVEAAIAKDLSLWDPFAEVLRAGFDNAPTTWSQALTACPRPDMIQFMD